MRHSRLSPHPDSGTDSAILQHNKRFSSKHSSLPMESKSHSPSPPLNLAQKTSPTPHPPLRLAVLGDSTQHSELLTYLARTPGVEIITHPDKNQEQGPAHGKQGFPQSTGSTSESVMPNLSPHVLIDFRSAHVPPNQPDFIPASNIDIIQRRAVDLLWHLQRQEQTTQGQMTQIEKLANIGTLASGILHDINNPLYVILGFSELLLDETLPPEIREPLTEVVQATKRIMAMCQDLNLYARERLPQSCAPTRVVQQLEEALKVGRFASGLENVQIIRSFEADPMILAKQEEIIQIFVNLIVNALQAMNGQGTLTLNVWQTQDHVHLTIKDSGPGIPPELQKRVWDPFYTTKPPGKGTGLGLHSVRLLIQHYGGHIDLDSTVGKGTTFHLTFPPYRPSPSSP